MQHHRPIVFVVDPDASIRASLEVVIHRAGWTAVCLPSITDFHNQSHLQSPSALLLEIGQGDGGGYDLLQHLANDRKETPVIAMSGQGDIPMTVRAMQAGAMEFLMKPADEATVLAAITRALHRSSAVLQADADMIDLRIRYEFLSAREREVMMQVVAGLLNKQVGAVLGISEITVKAHRGKVMRKMGADSLAELVGMAMRLHLSPAPARHAFRFMAHREIAQAPWEIAAGGLVVALLG